MLGFRVGVYASGVVGLGFTIGISGSRGWVSGMSHREVGQGLGLRV